MIQNSKYQRLLAASTVIYTATPVCVLALQAPHFHTTYIEEFVFCTREDNGNVNKKHSPNPSKKVVIKFRENTRIQVFAA